MHSFLISIPIAIVLWALMLLGVAVAVVLMARPRGAAAPASARPGAGRVPAGSASGARSRSGRSSGAARSSDGRSSDGPAPADRSGGARSRSGRSSGAFVPAPRSGSEAIADDLRFADEVTVAAGHAATTAARARAAWEDAQGELDAAWTAYEEADAVARRTWSATSFPLMSRRRKLGENADRERYLHRAATAACRQRELTIAQLNDVYAHRGWNPRLHPVAQEALLRNAIRENRFADYQAAQVRERAAWQQAEIAAEALRALRAEAAAAFGRTVAEQPVASEFWWADQWTTGELPVAA